MKTSHVLDIVALGILALTGCSADADEASADPSTETSDLSATSLVGDFHYSARSVDEAFLLDGALVELSLTKKGNEFDYEAIQVADGCSTKKPCTTTQLLSGEHGKKIAGTGTLSGKELTLNGDAKGIRFQVKTAKVNDESGLVLTSVSDKALSKGGASAFFAKTSRAAEDAFVRAHVGSTPLSALTKTIDPNDGSIAAPVRAGLEEISGELSTSDEETANASDRSTSPARHDARVRGLCRA